MVARGRLGRSREFETIAYIGLFDLRYFIAVIAAIKVGYKVSITLKDGDRTY
jgi:hypothetical protein